jgi:hypothetical protein
MGTPAHTLRVDVRHRIGLPIRGRSGTTFRQPDTRAPLERVVAEPARVEAPEQAVVVELRQAAERA